MNGDALRKSRDRLSTSHDALNRSQGALDMNGVAFQEVRAQPHKVRDAREGVRGALHIDGGTVGGAGEQTSQMGIQGIKVGNQRADIADECGKARGTSNTGEDPLHTVRGAFPPSEGARHNDGGVLNTSGGRVPRRGANSPTVIAPRKCRELDSCPSSPID